MPENQWRDGAKAAAPIAFGYLPVGLAFGVLAQRAGMTPVEAGLMSLLVYAGSSQFIAVEMISEGVTWFPIVITTFFVNLRYFLMSSSLSLHLRGNSLRMLTLLSAQLTDESFAVAMANTSKIENRPRYLFGLQIASQSAWVAGSVAGALFGNLIDHEGYGLPFALPGLFICLLVLQIRDTHCVWVSIFAGFFSLFFKWLLPGNWNIVLATLLASGIGMAIKKSSKLNVESSKPRIETSRDRKTRRNE